jgi:hypothetical protein
VHARRTGEQRLQHVAHQLRRGAVLGRQPLRRGQVDGLGLPRARAHARKKRKIHVSGSASAQMARRAGAPE